MVMRYFYAELNNDSIVKSVLDTHAEIVAPNMMPLASYDIAKVGQRWTGSAFEPVVSPPSVPQRVLRGPALKIIFTQLNRTKADLLAMADALPDPQKTLMRIDIEESTHFERNNPTLLALAQSLNLTSQQLDDLFIAAAAI
jgi:hypothetical protein